MAKASGVFRRADVAVFYRAGHGRSLGLHPQIRKIPWSRRWQPAPVFLPRKFHGQRSLAGYSPWGHKESDTTERAHMHTLLNYP